VIASHRIQPQRTPLFPKLITRYVVGELAKIFFLSSFAFVALMLIVGVVDEAADRGLGPDILLRLVPYILPKALMFAMPATCLFSVCVVFGRLAADNELIAIQTMGLHKSVVIFPALVLAFLLSLFAVWVNDVSFAWSYWGIEKVVLESTDKIIRGSLQNDGVFKISNLTVEVEGIEGDKLIQPVITYVDANHETVRAIAQEATISCRPETHTLIFEMKLGRVTYEKNDLSFEDKQAFEFQMKSPEEIAKSTGNPTHLYLGQIGGEIKKQEIVLEQIREDNAIRACSQMITGDLVGLTNADWTTRSDFQDEAQQRLSRLHVVPHRRWASGFSCLAFALVGIPVAIRLKTANYATTFGVCFLPILLVYYPLFMFGLNGAKMGSLPPLAAWFGDLACLVAGSILLYREFKR
jgi:lipopolysaccharide export system permease protein